MKPYKQLACGRCDGHGVVRGFMYDDAPDECPDCGGSGTIVRYESGVYASWPGGPLLGRDTKTERTRHAND